MHTPRIGALGAAVAAVAMLGLLTAAPASAAQPRPGAAQPRPGRLVQVAALDAPLRLAGAGDAWRVAYRSTSWLGRPTVVTGTVTVPGGRPPAGGWPVASFGHGFAGTADACAASRTGPSPWERAVQEALVAAGFAVVVADYEGIGTPAESPVVDGRAEAYGMIDIVRAARRLAPVSRSWAAVGYSLGGHAALFAAWLAPTYAPELHHTGTVAMAPVTQWAAQLASPFVRDPAAPANPTLPYSGRSLALTSGGTFHPADYFTATGLALVELAGTACIDQMAVRMAGLTNAEVFLDPAAAADGFQTLMADEEIPVGRYARPIQLVHGDADPLPALLTEITAGQLAGAGSDVRYHLVPGADHLTLLPTIAADVLRWIGGFGTA
jgi:hypothetical protein